MASITIIDDDNQIRLLIRKVLEAMGHEVIEPTNGREALESLPDSSPSLWVVDILMPEVDGIEIIRGIRRINTHVPILAISGGFSTENIDVLAYAQQFGATQIMQKPFDIRTLVKTVQSLLEITPTSSTQKQIVNTKIM